MSVFGALVTTQSDVLESQKKQLDLGRAASSTLRISFICRLNEFVQSRHWACILMRIVVGKRNPLQEGRFLLKVNWHV